ncbi:bactofilin family protein [Fodinibius sp. AD559]|uniref:bactofilin family protein n=1 Tax=Fodinibius sp. AD559 TaxID=3424179 RepID=UPI004046CF56
MDDNDTFISKFSFFQGNVFAKSIIVEGRVAGNLKASSSILIKEDGRVEGDIQAPNVYLEKGCYHEGAIYLDDSENTSSPKEDMNQPEFKSGSKGEAKTQENNPLKTQPVSSCSKSKLW